RRLARVIRVDDHLRVGQIGKRIQRRMQDRIDTRENREGGAEQNQRQIASRRRDSVLNHGVPAELSDLSADCKLLSASIRKLADVATASPSRNPSWIST